MRVGLVRLEPASEPDWFSVARSIAVNSPGISIHLVTRANASLLGRVDDDVFDHEVKADLLDAFLSNPANLLVVAVFDGQVVGMASGISYVHPDKPRSLFINEVGVSFRFQRRGLGRQLVSRMLQQGKELGCTEAWVATEAGNKPARALYESLGGVPDEEHAVVYVYRLSSKAGSLDRSPAEDVDGHS